MPPHAVPTKTPARRLPRATLAPSGDYVSLLPKPSVVLFVADVPRMTQFYQTLAAMVLLREDSQHAVLELEGSSW